MLPTTLEVMKGGSGVAITDETESIPSKSNSSQMSNGPQEQPFAMKRVTSSMLPVKDEIVIKRVSIFMGVRPTTNHGKRLLKRDIISRPPSLHSGSSNGGKKHAANSSDIKKVWNENKRANSNKSRSHYDTKRASDTPSSFRSDSVNSSKDNSADSTQDTKSMSNNRHSEFMSRDKSICSGSDTSKVKKREPINKRNDTKKASKKLMKRWMRTLSHKSATKKGSKINMSMKSPSVPSVAPFAEPKQEKFNTIEENRSHESQSSKKPSKETETSTVSLAFEQNAIEILKNPSTETTVVVMIPSVSSVCDQKVSMKPSSKTRVSLAGDSTSSTRMSASTSPTAAKSVSRAIPQAEHADPRETDTFSHFTASDEEDGGCWIPIMSCNPACHCDSEKFEAAVEEKLFRAADEACFDREIKIDTSVSQDSASICTIQTDHRFVEYRDDDETHRSLVDDCTVQSARSANITIGNTRDDSDQGSIYTETTDIDDDSVITILSASNQETLGTVGSTLFTRASSRLSMNQNKEQDKSFMHTRSVGLKQRRGTTFDEKVCLGTGGSYLCHINIDEK